MASKITSGAFPAKWQGPGGHLVQDRAKGEQVAARIEFLGANLFRRHIGYGAHRSAAIGEGLFQGRAVAAGTLGLENLDQSEVEDLGVTARGDENVGRLDVAMHNASGMRGVQRVGDLDGKRKQCLLV